MGDYRYCVSLQVTHPERDLEFLSTELQIDPFVVWKVGEPRISPKGTPLDGVYKYNRWAAKLHDKKRLHSNELNLEDFLDHLNQKFLPHKAQFKEIVETGGYIEYFVGWFSEENIMACFSPDLLKETAELNVAIGLDIYAYTEDVI